MTNLFDCFTNYNYVLVATLIIILIFILISSTNQSESVELFEPEKVNKFNFDDMVKTYVINLKNRPEKRKYMESQLTKHEIKFNMFEAINGTQLDLDNLNKSNIINEKKTIEYMKRRLRRGEYGCALSHILIWAEMLKHASIDTKYFLIFEDDAYLVNNFKKKVSDVISNVENVEWDVLFLNENCYGHFGESCNGEDFSEKTILPKRIGYGLYGYIINRKFVEKCFSSLFPIYYAIDALLDEWSLSKKYICIRSKEILVHYNKKFSSDTQLIL